MTQEMLDRIIEMAWEDRTPFKAIAFQFELSEAAVIRLMRKHLRKTSFVLWRKRVKSGNGKKYEINRNKNTIRFKSKMQRTITLNKISKR